MEKTDITPKEYCGNNGLFKYAGIHLIVEVWNSKYLSDLPRISQTIKDAVAACNAHLLDLNLHEFSPHGGVSGVAVLQESHLSIHTWPEFDYAAMDIFVCGTIDPYKAIPVIRAGLEPRSLQVVEIKRGIM